MSLPATPSPNGTPPLATLTRPPTTADGSFGQSTYLYSFRLATATVSSGPNQGYPYVANALADTSTDLYELNPSLTNTGGAFYQAQYGKCGFPSVSQIVAAVNVHEYSGTPSNYSQVAAALASNNPGTEAESLVGSPGETSQDFANRIQPSIVSLYQSAFQAGNPEPPSTLPNGINFPPYQPLPPKCQ